MSGEISAVSESIEHVLINQFCVVETSSIFDPDVFGAIWVREEFLRFTFGHIS